MSVDPTEPFNVQTASNMGIDNQASIVWRSVPIETRIGCYLVEQLFLENKTKGDIDENKRTRPCVAVDCNLVGYKKVSSTTLSAVQAVKAVARVFIADGIDVILYCDGIERHDSKRESIIHSSKENLRQKMLHST